MRPNALRLLPVVPLLVACGVVGSVATVLPAQIPARAVLLSAQHPLNEPRIVQRDDVVNLFATTSTATPMLLQWRSVDGGHTWPIQERPLTPPAVATAFGGVHQAPGALVVLVGDHTTGPMVLRSTDGGATWSAPIPVAASFTSQLNPVACAMYGDGALVVVAWRHHTVNGRTFVNRSTDAGLTWQATDTPLDVGSPPPATLTEGVHCVGNGAVVHVVWIGSVPAGVAALHQRSVDGGLTWRAAPVAVAMRPATAVTTDGPSVVVLDDLGGFHRSADFGDTWTPLAIPFLTQGHDVGGVGSVMLAAGTHYLSSLSYVFNVSRDGGQTWQANPLQQPVPTGMLREPHVHAGAGRLWVHFRGWFAPYLGALTCDLTGSGWQVVAGAVDAGFAASDRRTIHVALTLTANGNRLVAYVGTGGSSLGVATAGTGGIAPTLANVGLPLQGQSTELHVDRAVGGSVGGLGISFAPPVPLPLGSAVVWPTTAAIVLTLTTSGATGAAGAGSHVLPIAVPVNPALVDTSFTAQALVFDAGAADGFTVTNALTVWLR
jgi:photosystem II stability/assembly factor-like uncharacterized protein